MATAKRKTAPAALPRLFVISHNHPHFNTGGTEILAHNLYEEFNRSETYDTYFLAASNRQTHTLHPGSGLHSIPNKPREFMLWGDRFDYFMQSQAVPQILSQEFVALLKVIRPDIVHFHHTLRLGLEAIRVVRNTLPNTRIIYTLHDFIPICRRDGQMVRTTLEELCDNATPARCHECFSDIPAAQFKAREHFIKTLFADVDAFIAPSEFLRQRYIDWGIPAHKLHIIRNGIPATKAAPQRTSAKRNRFAYFGQISPYKGVLILLEAVQQLRTEGFTDFHLDIHGGFAMNLPEFEKLWQKALNACGDSATYHGAYKQPDLPNLMAQTDWVVMPSIWWENSPLVIDEALAHRRPVICSDIGGMAEKITDGVNGLHAKVGNSASLATAIKRAATEKPLWEQLTKTACKIPTISDCATAHNILYKSLEKL